MKVSGIHEMPKRERIPVEEILKHVQKPGRYLGGEWNEIKKDPESVQTKIALVFPDLYEVGMSYLGQKILYDLLNRMPSVLAERVYAPGTDLEEELRKRKVPLFSLENRIPLDQFDIVGFSLLYELNYTNILTVLDLGRIAFLSAERKSFPPLIIAGGPAAFNPEPLAGIFDLFLIGDGEEAFSEIIARSVELRKEKRRKNELLKEMSQIKGVYVPSLYKPYKPSLSPILAVKSRGHAPSRIEKRVLFPFDMSFFPEDVIVPNIEVVFDRVAVEIERGCPQKCRFCQAASLYAPARVRDPSWVIEKVLNGLGSSGYEETSLAALSVSDYPYLSETVKALMQNLARKKISLSLPSLRPKGLTEEITENILKVRKTGFTLVPEAGTERLRQVINKNLTENEIWEAASNAFSHGWKLLKLYFMVGLPTEKQEDLEGIVETVKKIIQLGYEKMNKPPQINLSISSFIPKPHTPFQWLKMENEDVLREKHQFLLSRLKKYPFVQFKRHSLKNSLLEAVFSRGDRRLTPVLIRAWANGARFDGWSDQMNSSAWEKAFLAEGVNPQIYLSALSQKAKLPWDHISTGMKRSFLVEEMRKAFREERTPSCLERKCGECLGCSWVSIFEKTFQAKIQPSWKEPAFIGRMTETLHRYRAIYAKRGAARFLSHRDVGNVFQRGFRRAGIPVEFSKGFHPHMMISYPPALPLGMEGKAEVLEFQSSYLFSKDEFVTEINQVLPGGLEFLELTELGISNRSLGKSIEAVVFSFDLNRGEVKNMFALREKEQKRSGKVDFDSIEKRIAEWSKKNDTLSIIDIRVDRKMNKLFIEQKFSPDRTVRPQDIVEEALGIENPVYCMAREGFVFKNTGN